jgi:toxin ParE1/3/4
MGHSLSPRARADIDEIAHYIALESRSLEAADRFLESVYQRFLLLGEYPHAGRRRDDLRPGLRVFPSGQYLVLYRVEGNDALIQRVVRGSRDLDALLREEGQTDDAR